MDDVDIDIVTSLRSEIAALQYKRDQLQSDMEEMRSQLTSRDQRCLDLKIETDQLREHAARQNAAIASLKKHTQDMEERERNLLAVQARQEHTIQSAHKDLRYSEEKIKELETKIRKLEFDLNAEEQKKESLKLQIQDFVRRLSVALGADLLDFAYINSESLFHKAAELIQETARLRNKICSIQDTLGSVELDLKNCRENLERSLLEKESLHRQCTAQVMEIDRLKQEKQTVEMQHRVLEREFVDVKNELAASSRSLDKATGTIGQHESMICQMRDDLALKEEKIQRLSTDHKHILDSVAILLSTPARFVDSSETSIKDRILELMNDNNDKSVQVERLREKLTAESQQLARYVSLYDQATVKIRSLEDEKTHMDAQLQKADTEINACEISRDALIRDKSTFVNFLERLARALNMDEISQDLGIDLHTETILMRAEQLARLESEKLVDKITKLVFFCRLFSFDSVLVTMTVSDESKSLLPYDKDDYKYYWPYDKDYYYKYIWQYDKDYYKYNWPYYDKALCDWYWPREKTTLIYQLQRRVRNLREQLQRKELHLDLLRRKLSLQEDNTRTKCLIQNERDEANLRVKKLVKQVDRLQLQLAEAKSQIRDLNAQLAEAADYKIISLEKGRKLEDLQKRLIESETLRNKCNRKVTLLKDQVRTTGDTVERERNISEHSIQHLRDDLTRIKENLLDVQRREAQLQNFKHSVAKILNVGMPIPDYDLISRLQKLVDAHHDFTLVSRRYDDPVLRLATRSPTGGSRCTRTPDRSRYDDSGYIDGVDLDV
ncbi:coiled-coil domain-containing protein 170 [Diabrotica undecimpunctata]|uniref:coiled-coil domain-containing protein 170 n=1 Tax=Diabrotica undecimpunctata TaxID=50387 RepID=UPI003B63CFEF